MAERTNEDIIRIVTKWQAAGLVHELTCEVDSEHEALVPIERDGAVILECPTCHATQDHIPAAVLGSEPVIDYNLEMMNRHFAESEIARARGDAWFAVAVIMACATILPFLIGGLTVGLIGGAIGGAVSYVYARRAFRKLDELVSESRP